MRYNEGTTELLNVNIVQNLLKIMFYPHVKSEAEASPDLSPLHHHFHFKFPPSHDHQSRTPSDDTPTAPLYRFGAYSTNPSHTPTYMSYSDDYDDLPILPYAQSSSDRTIRRRSSKGKSQQPNHTPHPCVCNVGQGNNLTSCLL